jgi:hypothetical protein
VIIPPYTYGAPKQKKPKNAIVYMEYIKLARAETLFLKKKDITVLVKPKMGIITT